MTSNKLPYVTREEGGALKRAVYPSAFISHFHSVLCCYNGIRIDKKHIHI